jgi:hypothetical protein
MPNLALQVPAYPCSELLDRDGNPEQCVVHPGTALILADRYDEDSHPSAQRAVGWRAART